MGHSGHINKGSPLHSHPDHVPCRSTCTVICVQHRQFAWSAKNNYFGSRVSLYFNLLVKSPSSLGDSTEIQYHLSSSDRWTDRVGKRNTRRYAYLPYAEFSYNNSFQTSLKMSPYEALYGLKCRTPLNWTQTGDSRIFGTDLMMEAEKQVKEIRDRLQLAKSRQKSYYDAKHRQISFEPEEHVYL